MGEGAPGGAVGYGEVGVAGDGDGVRVGPAADGDHRVVGVGQQWKDGHTADGRQGENGWWGGTVGWGSGLPERWGGRVTEVLDPNRGRGSGQWRKVGHLENGEMGKRKCGGGGGGRVLTADDIFLGKQIKKHKNTK